jgi:hypothetical protein
MKAAHMWNEWAMIQGILEGHHTHKQQQLYTFEVETTVEGEIMAIKEATEEMIYTRRFIFHVIFESESKFVVDAISSRQIGISTSLSLYRLSLYHFFYRFSLYLKIQVLSPL